MSSKNEDLELPPHAAQSFDRRDSEETYTSNGTPGNSRQVKKRNRIPVSCNECRRRKLRFQYPVLQCTDLNRCDRKDPCAACVQRGDSDACKFTEPLSNQPYILNLYVY